MGGITLPDGQDIPFLGHFWKQVHFLFFLPGPVAQAVKNPPAMWETRVRSLGWEDPLEEGMATHFSILAWRIPWTEKPHPTRFTTCMDSSLKVGRGGRPQRRLTGAEPSARGHTACPLSSRERVSSSLHFTQACQPELERGG